jgi:hypothetical protein
MLIAWNPASLNSSARNPEPQVIRVLWRMQGPSKIMVARIERHPFGRELIVAFEDGDDVIETRFERVNFSVLEQRGEKLREVLAGKGWTALLPG